MPCPHFDVKIIQRSKRQSAVASAAYQSGERLFSEYDQKQKYYSHKSEIVHTEIMLPPYAPPEYADRNTLWNAAETQEKQWNSQLARRFVLAIPRELPPEQYADLIRDYCREFFVSKGMIADFAIHDKGDGNPHAHILLTMRAMDETGKWLPKSRKVYDLDENGERIRLASGRWKSHKEDTVDWNDQKYAEIWRQGWADTANRYLEAIGSPERLDLRSYARQGIDKIPTVHMGPAVSQLEKKGIQTNIGNLNRDIKAANSLMQSIRQMVRSLKGWLSGLKEKKAALLEALEQAKEPTIPELLSRYLDMRSEERTGWTSKGKLKGTVGDFNKVMEALDFLRQKVDRRFHCFGCQADGDVIDFVSRLENVSPKEAALMLAQDFSIPYEDREPHGRSRPKPRKRQESPEQQFRRMERYCFRVLSDYHNLLRRWKRDYAPKTPDEEWHPLFVEALQKQSHVEYLLDVLLFSDMRERAALIASYGKEVRNLERRMADLAARTAAGRDGHHRSRTPAPER